MFCKLERVNESHDGKIPPAHFCTSNLVQCATANIDTPTISCNAWTILDLKFQWPGPQKCHTFPPRSAASRRSFQPQEADLKSCPPPYFGKHMAGDLSGNAVVSNDGSCRGYPVSLVNIQKKTRMAFVEMFIHHFFR